MPILPDYDAQALELNQLELLNRILDMMNAYVVKNLLLVGSAPTAEIVNFYNPNLYRVAVQYYSDANLWTAIAQANNVMDPQVPGYVALLIPPKPSVDTGGILNPIVT